MKKLFYLTLLAVAALMLSACSPYSLTFSEVYNPQELSELRTFRIVTPDEGKLPPGMSLTTYYNIAAAIREQLVERGYTEDPTSPLLVNIGLTVRSELTTTPVTTMVPTWNPGPALPPPPPVGGLQPVFMVPRSYYWPNYTAVTQWVPSIYREGVLTMDLVNTALKSPVYTASVATILDNGDSQLRSLSGIADAVKVLFSKYPIPLLPQYKQK